MTDEKDLRRVTIMPAAGGRPYGGRAALSSFAVASPCS